MSNLKPYIVGIDPGAKTGIAIWQRTPEKLIYTRETDFLGAQKLLVSMFPDRSEVRVFVEEPNRMVYGRNADRNGKMKGSDYQSINVGMNRRESQLLRIMLKDLGYEAEGIPPIREHKWTQQQFQVCTRSKLKVSEHERDAARLAFVNLNRQ